MSIRTNPAGRLHLAVERVASLFRSHLRQVAAREGLKLVQLEALIYFSVANRYSDTPGALAEYLGITKGTAGQTILALERRKLLKKVPDIADRRVQHCRLTARGQTIAGNGYPASIFGGPSSDTLDAAAEAAIELLRRIQTASGGRSFGQCGTCRHFREDRGTHRCGLTSEELAPEDPLRICREHESP